MINIYEKIIVENEHLYGPGKRLLIFLKGCSIHCNGCVNAHLWSFDGGTPISEDEILLICQSNNLDGVTIHGGEPLDQSAGLEKIVNRIKKSGLSIILFTGYLKRELNKTQRRVWDKSDIVIAGRFMVNKRNVNLQFRGSTNQKVYFHKGRYKNYELKDGYTTAIITIDENGKMNVNGFLTDDIKKLIDN